MELIPRPTVVRVRGFSGLERPAAEASLKHIII